MTENEVGLQRITETEAAAPQRRDVVWKPVPPLVQIGGGTTTRGWFMVACSTYVPVSVGEPFFWHPLVGWYA